MEIEDLRWYEVKLLIDLINEANLREPEEDTTKRKKKEKKKERV